MGSDGLSFSYKSISSINSAQSQFGARAHARNCAKTASSFLGAVRIRQWLSFRSVRAADVSHLTVAD
jgi:hypothetical protein